MTHGVTPRVHGNHGKRPHNRFSLDIYQQATAFLQSYIQRAQNNQPGRSNQQSNKMKGKERSSASSIVLPPDITCKTVHSAYKEYMEHFEPGTKWLGFSTFRHFMKRQFPLVKFSAPMSIPSASEQVHTVSHTYGMISNASEPKNLEHPPPVVTTDRVVVVVEEDEYSAVGRKTAPVATLAQETSPSPASEDVSLQCRPTVSDR